MITNPGVPSPLGLCFIDDQVNFSLHIHEANACSLLLYNTKNSLTHTIVLDPILHKTGSIWHISLNYEIIKGFYYEFLINHQLLGNIRFF
jgi:hypothetical protein